MAEDLSIQELKKQLERLKQSVLTGRFADALIGALNTGSGLMQQRIFRGNVDIQGEGFGGYIGKKTKISQRTLNRLLSKATPTNKKRIKRAADLELTPYQRKRLNFGRQIAKKDLELFGGLRRAIETQIENEKSAVLRFNNIDAAKIARGQEQQIYNIRTGKKGTTKGTGATPIFALDENEKNSVKEQSIELIKQIIA